MSRKAAMHRRNLEKACKWNQDATNPQSKNATGFYRVDRKTAFDKITQGWREDRKTKLAVALEI